MSADEFVQYAQSLGLLSVDKGLLEFLERERLLVPACRVRLSEDVARRDWLTGVDESLHDPSLPVNSDDIRQEQAVDLVLAINWWRAIHPEQSPTFHPLDLVNEGQLGFVDNDVAAHPFQPWDSFRVRMGLARADDGTEHPVYDDHAVRTYFHYWQVFLLAEALTVGATVIADLRDREIWRAFISDNLDALPARRWIQLEVDGLRTLQEATPHLPALDALAFFLDYTNRLLTESRKNTPGSTVLTGAQWQEYLAIERATAAFAIWWKGTDAAAILSLIRWQCGQWDHWHQRGPQRFADECRRNIEQAGFLYRLVTGASWREVVEKIGRATSYMAPALDVISPDWLYEQHEAAGGSLKRWIAPTMQGWAALGFDLTEPEVDDMVAWVSSRGLLQFFLLFAQIKDLSEYESSVSLAVQAKATEGFGATIEHMLNDIGQGATAHPDGGSWPMSSTLGPKVAFLWSGTPAHPHLHGGLCLGLTNTAPGFAVQRQAIAALPGAGPGVEVGRALLEMLLIRNQSIHGQGGLTHLDRQELSGLIQILLRGAVLNWKQARRLGWV